MIDTKKEQEREELHRTIWGIANDLRGSVDGWDFKQYVLGMLFYRYISENFRNYINEGEIEAGNADFDYAKLSDEEAEKTRLSEIEYYHDAFMYEKEVRENMGYRSVSSAYHSLYEKDVRWTCPWLIEVCKLCLEYLMLEGLADAKRATDIPGEVQQIVGKTLTHDDLNFILSDCEGDEYQLSEESFLNFCAAMQCAEVRYADVLSVLKELCHIADDNGYGKELIRKMLDKLQKD